MSKTPPVKKVDQNLLSSVKTRKKSLERDAAKLRKEISNLTERLYELQKKINLMEQLIASEAPKKRSVKKVAASENLKGGQGRIPAAVKKV
jgi:peptidoglycan hydrolase CwlO-like protein